MDERADDVLTRKLDDMKVRLESAEQMLIWLATVRARELVVAQRAPEASPVNISDDPKRPLQTDGLGPWPPNGQPLPDGWVEVPRDQDGGPQRPEWDPWNPEIPESGKVITYDPERKLFRIECGGVRYEIPWRDMEPSPPFSNPGPPTGLKVDPGFIWIEVTPEAVEKRIYFRQAHCKTQVTCVVTYRIRVAKCRVWVTDPEGRVVTWLSTRADITYRTEVRRRTSDFTCPKQIA